MTFIEAFLTRIRQSAKKTQPFYIVKFQLKCWCKKNARDSSLETKMLMKLTTSHSTFDKIDGKSVSHWQQDNRKRYSLFHLPFNGRVHRNNNSNNTRGQKHLETERNTVKPLFETYRFCYLYCKSSRIQSKTI